MLFRSFDFLNGFPAFAVELHIKIGIHVLIIAPDIAIQTGEKRVGVSHPLVLFGYASRSVPSLSRVYPEPVEGDISPKSDKVFSGFVTDARMSTDCGGFLAGRVAMSMGYYLPLALLGYASRSVPPLSRVYPEPVEGDIPPNATMKSWDAY